MFRRASRAPLTSKCVVLAPCICMYVELILAHPRSNIAKAKAISIYENIDLAKKPLEKNMPMEASNPLLLSMGQRYTTGVT